MALDSRRAISAVEIAFYSTYVPILTLFLTFRHGFKREVEWVSLLMFSVVRVIGAALLLAADSVTNPSSGLLVATSILDAAGLSLLFSATLGFLEIVGQYTRSGLPVASPRIFRIVRFSLVTALVLVIVGDTESSRSSSSNVNVGNTFRQAGSVFYVAVFIIIVALHARYWAGRDQISATHRTLLITISAALPFLAIRIIYTLFSSLSPNSLSSDPSLRSPPNSLSKFNSITGAWQLCLSLSVAMEFAVIIIYCAAGTLPLRQGELNAVGRESEEHELYAPSAPTTPLPHHNFLAYL